MERIDFTNYLQRLPSLLKETNKTCIVSSQETCILCGVDDYKNEHNLPTYKTHNFGGVIVNFKNDICVGHYETLAFKWGSEFMEKLCDYLKSRNLNAEINGNDILVDNYKVASYMSQNINSCIYTAVHISISMDLDLIKNICVKPMVKTPKGLEEYNITQDEIIEWVGENYGN